MQEIIARELEQIHIRCTVSGRRKHLYSIYQKMQRQQLSFEDIHDILAVRVMTDTVRNCYAALGMLHALWKPIPGRFKDYIALQKPNMYQSLHTTVLGPDGERVELQIRTEEMHRIAEEGIAAIGAIRSRRRLRNTMSGLPGCGACWNGSRTCKTPSSSWRQ